MTDERLYKRIHSSSFLKYFTLKTPYFEISDDEVNKILNLWEKSNNKSRDIDISLKTLKNNRKLDEFIDKLSNYFVSLISEKLAIEIIRHLNKNINILKLRNSTFNIVKLINEKIPSENLQSFLEEIINNCPDLLESHYILYFCKNEGHSVFFNIYDFTNYPDLYKTWAARMKEYFIDSNRDIFDEAAKNNWDRLDIVLYQWAIQNRSLVNDYIFPIMEKEFNKFIVFLKCQSSRDFEKLIFNFIQMERGFQIERIFDLANNFLSDKSIQGEDSDLLKKYIFQYKKHVSADSNQQNPQ